MTQYQTKPVDLVDGLRQVADLLAAMTDVELPQFFVDLNFTVSSHNMDSPAQEDERAAAVCALMAVLTPALQADFWAGSSVFGTPMTDPVIGGLNVSVHTNLTSAKERALREEIDRLNAQLAAANVIQAGQLPIGDDTPVPFDSGTGPMPGYMAGWCGHRVAESEWRAGFRVCERCPDPRAELAGQS